MKIKAISTKYKGYNFRSRLEARWAVFFDSLNIKWEYEKEGYIFGNGIKYLPDFWLPEVRMWAEVKAEEFNEIEIKKVKSLAISSKKSVLMLIGIPENKPYEAFDGKDGMICSEYVLSNYHNYPKIEGRFYCMPGENIKDFPYHFPDTEKAVKKSKSARFEFHDK